MSLRWPRHPFGLLFAALLLGLAALSAPCADVFAPLDIRAVKLGGEMGRRIDVTVTNNLLVLNADKDFLSPFADKNGKLPYIGLGKLIDSAVTLAAYTGDPRVIALKKHLVDETLKRQETDGYPGAFPAASRMTKLWDIHEVQYIAWGLLADYEKFGRRESLAAARSTADYLIDNWSKLPPDWCEGGVAEHVAVTGVERTMVELHRVTGEKRYLDFVVQTRKLPAWDLPIVIGRRYGIEGHIYAYLARTLALLELYRGTGDGSLMRIPDRTTEFMRHGEGLMITGSGGQWEIWTDDQDGRGALGETCATAYQLRIYDAMLRQKGEAVWGDLMERTIFNTLFAAQSPDGRQLRYFSPTEGPRKYHPTDTYCCPCNYRRIVAELPTFAYYTTEEGIVVNLYEASRADVTLPKSGHIGLQQETDYPSSGTVTIRVKPDQPSTFALQLRIPAWADGTKVTVNGDAVKDAVSAGHFLSIRREWAPDDTVKIDMPMPFRLVAGRQRQAGRVAVMRGPMVYCLDPAQSAKLKNLDGVELSRLILDLATMKLVSNSTVRPGGTACRVKAWMASFGMARPPHAFDLTLTEYPDPAGQQTYFSLSDPKPAVEDELFGRRMAVPGM